MRFAVRPIRPQALAALPRALAAEERSTVTIGFLMLSVALFLCVAAIWNTGSLVDRKMQTQAVADSAALTAATELANTMNDMVTQNMLELRLQSASLIQKTIRALKVLIPIKLAAAGLYAASYCSNPFTLAYGLFLAGLVAHDSARYAKFLIETNKAESVGDILNATKQKYPKLTANLNQNVYDSVKMVDKFVNGSRNKFKIYVGSKATPYYPTKATATNYLLTKPSYGAKLGVFAIRVLLFDQQWKTVDSPFSLPNPKDSTLRDLPANILSFLNTAFMNGFKAKLPVLSVATFIKIEWFMGMGIGILANAKFDWSAYVPKVNDDDDKGKGRQHYQIIACVVHPNDDAARQDNYMAPVFFGNVTPSENIVAVAAAEVNNPNYDFLASIPVVGSIINFLPWRYWSSFGVNYQSRLTRVSPTVFMSVVKSFPDLQKALAANAGGKSPKGADYGNVFLH